MRVYKQRTKRQDIDRIHVIKDKEKLRFKTTHRSYQDIDRKHTQERRNNKSLEQSTNRQDTDRIHKDKR